MSSNNHYDLIVSGAPEDLAGFLADPPVMDPDQPYPDGFERWWDKIVGLDYRPDGPWDRSRLREGTGCHLLFGWTAMRTFPLSMALRGRILYHDWFAALTEARPELTFALATRNFESFYPNVNVDMLVTRGGGIEFVGGYEFAATDDPVQRGDFPPSPWLPAEDPDAWVQAQCRYLGGHRNPC